MIFLKFLLAFWLTIIYNNKVFRFCGLLYGELSELAEGARLEIV